MIKHHELNTILIDLGKVMDDKLDQNTTYQENWLKSS